MGRPARAAAELASELEGRVLEPSSVEPEPVPPDGSRKVRDRTAVCGGGFRPSPGPGEHPGRDDYSLVLTMAL